MPPEAGVRRDPRQRQAQGIPGTWSILRSLIVPGNLPGLEDGASCC